MTQPNDVLRFIKAALISGMILIIFLMFGTGVSLGGNNFLVLGGVSTFGLFAFCRIMERFVEMVDEI